MEKDGVTTYVVEKGTWDAALARYQSTWSENDSICYRWTEHQLALSFKQADEIIKECIKKETVVRTVYEPQPRA